MGLVIPQVITEDRASGAQVIDGSLRFNSASSHYLNRTPGSAGNRRTWTWSGWVKRSALATGSIQGLFAGVDSGNSQIVTGFRFRADDAIELISYNGGYTSQLITSQVFRDVSSWYHLVAVYDTTQATEANRAKIYVNGVQITAFSTATYPSQNYDSFVNTTGLHVVGAAIFSSVIEYLNGYLSEINFIDGSALDPSYFGFTDPLTNTWRPKKYTGTYGTNGFYLPMDGNSPIGEDKSGNGNNWTPVNFGGSNTLEKATGALPILNTVNGGNVATAGVRTDANASSLVLALPLVGSSADVSNQINSGSTTKTLTANGNAAASSTQSNFYGGSYAFDGSGDYLSLSSSSDFALGTNDWTVEYFAYPTSTTDYQRHFYLEGSAANQIEGVFANSSGISFGKTNVWAPTQVPHPINQWNHYALVHDSTNMRLYINGVESLTSTSDFANENKSLNIGYSNSTFGGYFTGYIQDFRIYKGVAKYTSNFIPASTDPDILPETPSGVAGGSALTKITDGSVYFDGDVDSLTVPETASDEFTFGTGDWTIEGFVYFPVLPHTEYNTLITTAYPTNNQGIWFGTNNNGLWWANTAPAGSGWLGGSTGVSAVAKKWHHFAYVRNSDVIKVYIDGVEIYSRSDSSELSNTNNSITIGGRPSQDSNSYLSNVRVVKGTALYTSNFTPPTEPLTNVTNTVLLCCQSTTTFNNGAQPILNTNSTGSTVTSGTRNDPYASSIVLALAMNGSNGGTTFTDIHPTIKGSGSARSITVNGNSQTSTAQSKYYGSSGYFDGTGDSLDVASSSDFNVTTNYTVEAWVYFDSLASNTHFLGVESSYWIAYDTASIGGAANKLTFTIYNGSSWQAVNSTTTPVTGRWYHIAAVKEGTSLYFFLDGVKENTTTMSGSPYNNVDFFNVAKWNQGGTALNGYLQDIRVYTATAKYTKSFTVTEPTLDVPAAVTPGSITANGDAAATNFNPFTTDINAVRGQESGYATLNPLDNNGGTLSNGNLKSTSASASNVNATISVSSGKWYWEVLISDSASGGVIGVGAGGAMKGTSLGDLSKIYGWSPNGSKYQNTTQLSYSVTYGVGDLIGIKFDADSGELEFYKNGISRGVAFTVDSGYDYFPQFHLNGMNVVCNFGQKPFKYAPPEGFKTLCLANLPRPTEAAVRPDKYFNTVLYTGDGNNGRTVTGVGFQPDFTWIKRRDGSQTHALHDVVRGPGNHLATSSANAEVTTNSWGALSSFDSDGFTIAIGGNGTGDFVNRDTWTYVAWCWKAGGGSGTGGEFWKDDVQYASAAAAGLNGGSITPTGASVGTKQGFSIITYTSNGTQGATISHGLTQKPDFAIFKNRDSTLGTNEVDWGVYHSAIGATKKLELNQTLAEGTFPGPFNNTEPTSSVFTFGGNPGAFGHSYLTNGPSGDDFVGYIWHNVPGLQKFGSYVGNGSSNGPVIPLDFSPALIIMKSAVGGTSNWVIIDNRRPGNGNQINHNTLCANLSNGENASGGTTNDFLSNGFKIRGSTDRNASGVTYIYAAWAEAPTFNLYGAQANAR